MKIKHDKPVLQEKKTYFCNAYGCKLQASMGLGTDGTGAFYCRFHYGSKPNKNDYITLQIDKNKDLVNFLDMSLRPELFFEGLFDDKANLTLKTGLKGLELEHLWDESNYKISKNILGELNSRLKVDTEKVFAKSEVTDQFKTMLSMLKTKTFTQ
jgi:hypothetical protein